MGSVIRLCPWTEASRAELLQHLAVWQRTQAGVHRFYRIVTTIPPTLEDFTSRAARGKAPHSDDPRILRLEEGISVFVTLAQARAVARRFPVLGGFVAEIVIPDGSPVSIERTGGKGHHTIWGDPADIQRWVTSIYPMA